MKWNNESTVIYQITPAPILLTWFNFNPSMNKWKKMDKWSHAQKNVG